MADATFLQDLELVQAVTVDNPLWTVDEKFTAGGSSLVTNFKPTDPSGATITKNFHIGVQRASGYIETMLVTAAGSETLTVTAGIDRGGLDYDTAVPALQTDHDEGETIITNITGFQLQQTVSCLLGAIATGGNVFTMGNETDQNHTIQYRNSLGDRVWLRHNDATTKSQYSNDGVNWINMDSAAPANITVRSVAAGTANNLELYADSGDNDSLVFKDAGGFSLKLYDDTLQLIPQASVEVWKDITSDATELNQLNGTTTIAAMNTAYDTNGFAATETPNAGEAIAGATLPVAVYQNTSDNEVYACDGNDLTKLAFLGFATTTSTDGNPITVQTNGKVSGFTGLSEGTNYYVQDDQTIGTSKGTYPILVGVAVSETELVIVKENVEGIPLKIVSGNTIQATADTERLGTDNAYVEKKAFTVNYRGIVSLTFDLKRTGAGTAEALMYINDVATAILASDVTGSYASKTLTSSRLVAGDQVSLYLRNSSGGDGYGIQNVKLKYEKVPAVDNVVDLD